MSGTPEQPMSYRRALLALGNGDLGRGQQNLFMLARRLEEARLKQPGFAGDRFEAVHVISCEFHELCYAVTHESPDRQLDEALDVACTSMRFINGEHKIQRHKRG